MSNIRVAVRVRPISEKEKEDGSKEIVTVKRNTIAIENIKVLGIPEFGDSRARIKEFAFDHCYDSMRFGAPYSTQAQVFEDLGTEVLKSAYDGFNACVFAYGQTGTGKTHTMMGYQDDPGLIPRICEGLFSHVPDEEASPRITCRVDISYFEIYNERVRDLLQPDQFQQNPKFSLKVRNHPREGPYVEGLSWHRVKSNEEIQSLIDRGNEYRVTAETYIHDRSSRSHAIVTVCFTQARLEENRPSEIVSKINLVDLAGSERADPSSKPDFRKRLTEGANINRSLVTLGYIIKALAEKSLLSWDSDDMGSLQNFNSSGGGESLASNSPSGPNKQRLPFIPYRDSVLTWLLKDSLGGNSKTIMIATITPASQFYNESISTLRYAQRAKNIVNKPRINEDGNVALIRELRREIERLQEMLADAKKGGDFLTLPDSEDSIIAEKLHENEEMAKQLTESWMCKWSSTHDIMKESDLSIRGLRNQASSMGVMIDSQLPYLIGMDDDVLSTGVVIFHLKEGETYVGRDNAEKPQDIVLIGPNILTEHCIIRNNHGEVTMYPNPGSMCSVQGLECLEPTKLTQVLTMGPKRRKRIKKNGIAEEKGHLSDFIWLKIKGVGVFWPVQVVASSSEDELKVFCKSDDAEIKVKKQEKNIQPFYENLIRLKAQGIEYLKKKKQKSTLAAFIEDVSWAMSHGVTTPQAVVPTDVTTLPPDVSKSVFTPQADVPTIVTSPQADVTKAVTTPRTGVSTDVITPLDDVQTGVTTPLDNVLRGASPTLINLPTDVATMPADVQIGVTTLPAYILTGVTTLPADNPTGGTTMPADISAGVTTLPGNSPTGVTTLPADIPTGITRMPADNPTGTTTMPADNTTGITTLLADYPTGVATMQADISTDVTTLLADIPTGVTTLQADIPTGVTRMPADNPTGTTKMPADNTTGITTLPADNTTGVTTMPADIPSDVTTHLADIPTGVTTQQADIPTEVTNLTADIHTDATTMPADKSTGITTVPADNSTGITTIQADNTTGVINLLADIPTDVTTLQADIPTDVTPMPSYIPTDIITMPADVTTGITILPDEVNIGVTTMPADNPTSITTTPADVDRGVTTMSAYIPTIVTTLRADNPTGVTTMPADIPAGVTTMPADVPTDVTTMPADIPTGVTTMPADFPTGVTNMSACVPTGITMMPAVIPTGVTGNIDDEVLTVDKNVFDFSFSEDEIGIEIVNSQTDLFSENDLSNTTTIIITEHVSDTCSECSDIIEMQFPQLSANKIRTELPSHSTTNLVNSQESNNSRDLKRKNDELDEDQKSVKNIKKSKLLKDVVVNDSKCDEQQCEGRGEVDLNSKKQSGMYDNNIDDIDDPYMSEDEIIRDNKGTSMYIRKVLSSTTTKCGRKKKSDEPDEDQKSVKNIKKSKLLKDVVVNDSKCDEQQCEGRGEVDLNSKKQSDKYDENIDDIDDPYMSEDEIIRDNKRPCLYIRKVLSSTTTKCGRKKKSDELDEDQKSVKNIKKSKLLKDIVVNDSKYDKNKCEGRGEVNLNSKKQSDKYEEDNDDIDDPYMSEDEIIRDNKRPGLYIRKVLSSTTTKCGRKKKSARVYNSYHSCSYCNILVSNYAQHMKRKHMSKSQVKAVFETVDDKLRKQKIALMSAEMDNKYNVHIKNKGKGEILLYRRPTEKFDFDSFGPCPACLLWMSKRLLPRHQKICISEVKEKLTYADLITRSDLIADRVHEIASPALVNEVFRIMKNDDVGFLAREDPLIIRLGNLWMEKNVGNKLKRNKYTSQIMRIVAKLLINVRKETNTNHLLSDYLRPRFFDDVVKATLMTAGQCTKDKEYLESPSNAIKLGHDIKRLINIKVGVAIMLKDREAEEDGERFLRTMKVFWGPRVTKLASTTLVERQFNKRQVLPEADDIQRLNDYLNAELTKLDIKKSETYTNAAKLLCAKLVQYNRRRPGEIEAISLEDYRLRMTGASENAVFAGDLTPFERKLMETQEVLTTRGKGHRGVPILIPEYAKAGMEFIANRQVRTVAGVVNNTYLFAIPGKIKSVFRVYDCLADCCQNADLQYPERITATTLRKFMATMTQVLDLKPHQLEWVMRHMGHSLDIHKIYYRSTSDVIERTQIAKILLLQDSGRIEEFFNQSLEDIQLSGDYVVLGGDQVFRFNNPTEAAKLREHRRSQGSLNTLSTSHLSFGGLSRASSYSSIGGDDPNCLSPYSQLGRSYPTYAAPDLCLELEKKHQPEQERIDLARQELVKLQEEHERAEELRQEKEEEMYVQHEQHKQDLEDQKLHLARLIAENERAREKAEEELAHARESLAKEKEAFQKELDAERKRLKELETLEKRQTVESSGFQTDSPCTTTTSVGNDDRSHSDVDEQPTKSKVPRQMSVEDQLKELEENEFTRRMSYRETEQSLSIQEEDIEDQYLQTQEQIQAKIKQIKDIEEEYKELDKVHLQDINSQAEKVKELHKKEAQLEVYIQEKEELINVGSGAPTHLRSASSELFLAGQTLEIPEDNEQKTSSLQNVQSCLREDEDQLETPRALQRSDSTESLESELLEGNVDNIMDDKSSKKSKKDFKISNAARDVTSRLYKPPEPKFKYVPKTKEKEVKPAARTRVTRDIDSHSRGSPSRVLRDHSKGNSPSPQRNLGKQHSPSPARDKGSLGNKGNTLHKGANTKSDGTQGKGGSRAGLPVNTKARTLSPKTSGCKSPERSNNLSSVSGRLGASGKIRQMASASNLASVPESLSEGNDETGLEQSDKKTVIKRRNRRGRSNWDDDEFRTHSAPDSQSMAAALDKYTAEMNDQQIPGRTNEDKVIPSFHTSVSVDESRLSPSHDTENKLVEQSYEIGTESGIDVNSDNKSDTIETIDTHIYNEDYVILSGNLRSNQPNETIGLGKMSPQQDVLRNESEDPNVQVDEKVTLGKREHAPGTSDTMNYIDQDVIPAKISKPSDIGELNRSFSCSDDSLDVSSDSLEKGDGSKQSNRLTQSLPAYFFDNQKPSSEDSFNDSLEDQKISQKKMSSDSPSDNKNFDCNTLSIDIENHHAYESRKVIDYEVVNKPASDNDNRLTSEESSQVKRLPNLAFSKIVCHDNIDSLEQENLSNNEIPETDAQTSNQAKMSSNKSTISISVNTETDMEYESQSDNQKANFDSEALSNNSSISDPQSNFVKPEEVSYQSAERDTVSEIDMPRQSDNVVDNMKHGGEKSDDGIRIKSINQYLDDPESENIEKPPESKVEGLNQDTFVDTCISNNVTKFRSENSGRDRETEIIGFNEDQRSPRQDHLDNFDSTDSICEVRRYVDEVVAGAHHQICHSDQNASENIPTDESENMKKQSENKHLKSYCVHETNDVEQPMGEKQSVGNGNLESNLPSVEREHISSNIDIDGPSQDGPMDTDNADQNEHSKPETFTDTNNNYTTDNVLESVEPESAMKENLDEELSHVEQSTENDEQSKRPLTRTIGICTSPDLMRTIEGDEDSNDSLDPNEELQVLQDALDQLPAKPAPPGPQLSTARRAARQRAMIRQKQRAGDSDGIGHLSDESPGKGNQSTQGHRPDSGSRRRKRPSTNKNSRVNTDQTSDDYDSSENDSTYSNDSVDIIRNFQNQNGFAQADIQEPCRDTLFTNNLSDIDGAIVTTDGEGMTSRHLRRRDRCSPKQQNVESADIQSADGSSRSVGVQTFGSQNRGFSSSSLRTDVSDPESSFASGEFSGMVMSPVSVWNSNEGQNHERNSSSSSGIIKTPSDLEKSLSQTQRSNASFVSQGSNLERGPTEVWSSSTSDLRPVPVFHEDLSYVMETELMSPGASSLDYADQSPKQHPLAISSTHEDEGTVKRPVCSTPRSVRNVNISFPENQVQQVANIESNTPVTFEVTIHEENTNVLYNVEKTEYKTYALKNQESNKEPGIIPESIHVNITENVHSQSQEKFEVVKTENVNLSKDSVPNASNENIIIENSYKASYSSEHAMDAEKEQQSKHKSYRHEEVEESKNYILPAHARDQGNEGRNQLQASGVIGATSYNSEKHNQDPDSCKTVEEQLDVSDCTSDYGTITSIDGRKGLVSFTDSEDDSLLAGSPPASPHLSIASGTLNANILPPIEASINAPQQAGTISPDRYSVCSTEKTERPSIALASQIQMTVPSELRSQLYKVRHGNIDGDDYFEQTEEIYDDLRQKMEDSSDDDTTTKDGSKEDVETDSSSQSTMKPNSTIASQETLPNSEVNDTQTHPCDTDPNINDLSLIEGGFTNPFLEIVPIIDRSDTDDPKRNHKPSYSSNDDSFLSLEHSETSSNASDYRTPIQSPTSFSVDEDILKQVEDVVIPDTVSSNMALSTTPRIENSNPFKECKPVTTSSPKRLANVRTVSVNTDTSSSPTTSASSSTSKPILNSNNDPDRLEEFRKQLERKIAKIQHQHRSLSDSAISSDFTDGDSASLSPRSSKHHEFDKMFSRDQPIKPFLSELVTSLLNTNADIGEGVVENIPLNDSGNVYDQEQEVERNVDTQRHLKDNDTGRKPSLIHERKSIVLSQNILKFPESIVHATLAIKPFPVKRSLSLDSISTRVNTGTEHSRALREPFDEAKDANNLLDGTEPSNTPSHDHTANSSSLGESLNNHASPNQGNEENIPPESCHTINTKSVSCTNLKDDTKREYYRSLSDGNIEDFDNGHDSSADSNDSITFIFVGKDELDDGKQGEDIELYDPCGIAGAPDSESQSPELAHYSAKESEDKDMNISGRGFESPASVENYESIRSRSISHGSLDLSLANDGNEDQSSSHSASEEIEDIIKGNQVESLMMVRSSKNELRGRYANNESETNFESPRVMPNEDTSPLRHRFGIDEKILPISERSVSADNIPKLMTGYKTIQKSRSTGMLDVGVVAEPDSESDIFPPRPVSYDEDQTDPSFSLRTMSEGGLDQISQRTVSEIGASLSNKSSSGLEASTSNSISSARVRSVCSVASSSSEESYEEIVISYSNSREGSKRKRLKQGPDSTSSEGEMDIKTLEDRQAQIKHVLDTVEKFICPKPQFVDRGVSTESIHEPILVSIGMQTSLTDINETVEGQATANIIEESILPALASPFRAQSMDSFGLGAREQELQLSEGAISWVKMSELMVETTDLLRKINARLPEMERNSSLSSTKDGQAILQQWQEISLQADRSLSNVQTIGLQTDNSGQSLHTDLIGNAYLSNTANEYTQVDAQFRIDMLDQSEIMTSEILSEPPESNSCEVSIQTDQEEVHPHLNELSQNDLVWKDEYFIMESSPFQNSADPNCSEQFVKNDSTGNFGLHERNPDKDVDTKANSEQNTLKKSDGLFISQIKTDLGLKIRDGNNSFDKENQSVLSEDKSAQKEVPVLQEIILQNTKEIEELKKEHQKLMENIKRASEKRQNRKDTIMLRKKASDIPEDNINPLQSKIDNPCNSENNFFFEEMTEIREVSAGMFIGPGGLKVELPFQAKEGFKEGNHTPVNVKNFNSGEIKEVNDHSEDPNKSIQTKQTSINQQKVEIKEIVEIVEVGPGMFMNGDGSNAVLPSSSSTKPLSEAKHRNIYHNDENKTIDSPLSDKKVWSDRNETETEYLSNFKNATQSDRMPDDHHTNRYEEIIEICEVGPGLFRKSNGSQAILPSISDGSNNFEDQGQLKDMSKHHGDSEKIIEFCEIGPGVFLNSDDSEALLPSRPDNLNPDKVSIDDEIESGKIKALEFDPVTLQEEIYSQKEPKQTYRNDDMQSFKSDPSFESKNQSFEFEETVVYEVGLGKFWNEDLTEAGLPSCQKPNSNNDEGKEEEPNNHEKDQTDGKGNSLDGDESKQNSLTNKNLEISQAENGESEGKMLHEKVKNEENTHEIETSNITCPGLIDKDLEFNKQEDPLSNRDDINIEITETGRGVFIYDYNDKPQSLWIVGPGSYVPQEDSQDKISQVGPSLFQPPHDSGDCKPTEPIENGIVVDKSDKNKPRESKKQNDKPTDTEHVKDGEKKGKRHEHTWQLKDNEVIAISDERPVSSSSSSRMRSDSEASLSSIDTATSAEVARVLEGKDRKHNLDIKPFTVDPRDEDNEVGEHFTPVNIDLNEEEQSQREDYIIPEFHSRNTTSPTQVMKNLKNNGSVNKKTGQPVLPETVVRCETSPKLPSKLYSKKPIDSSSPEIFKPIYKEEGTENESDNPSDTSMNTVNESFTEIIESKPEVTPVLKDGDDKAVIFKKNVPVLANSPEIFQTIDETEQNDYPDTDKVNNEIDTSLDTVNESFTEIIENKHETTPAFDTILKDSKNFGASNLIKEVNPNQHQRAPRFGRSDDATQVSMEFSDDFTQTDDGTIIHEIKTPPSPSTTALLKSSATPQKTNALQPKSGSERLKEDLEKLQLERLHILDLLGMNYLPTSLTVELLEAKLNYCIGQTDLLLESVEEEFTSTDTSRPYTREQQRAVDYISKYRADLKKSKQDIQECREKLNHRKSAGIGRGRTHVRKRDVFNQQRQAFIDAFKLERLREQQDYERSRHGTPVRGNTPLKGNTPLMGNSPVVTPRSEASRSSSPTYIPGYMTPREHKDHLVDLRRQLIRDIAEEEYYHRSISPRSTHSLHTSPPPHHRYRSSPDMHLSYPPKVSVSLADYQDRSHPVCNTYIVAPGTHSLTAVPRSLSLDGIRPHTHHSSPSPPRHNHTRHSHRHLSPPSTFDTRMTADSIYSPQESAQIYREIEELKKRSPNMSAPLEEMLRRSSFSSTGSHRSNSSRGDVGISPRAQSDSRLIHPRHHSPETQSDPRLTHLVHHSPETQRYDNPLSLNLDSLQDDTQGPYSPYSAYAREHIIPNERSSGGVLRGSYQLYEDRSDTSSNVSYGSDTHSDSGHYHGLDEDTVKRLRPVRSSDIKARIGRHKR